MIDTTKLMFQAEEAARNNNLESLKCMVKDHPDLLQNKCEFTGTPLYETIIEDAASAGNMQVLEYIFSLGYDINCEVKNGTALEYAASESQFDTVKWLLKKGALIDGIPGSIISPLAAAITFGHNDLTRFLIQEGADVNRIHLRLFQTPLDLAYIWGRTEVIDLLIEKGAVSPLKPVFTEYNHEQVIRMFIHHNGGPIMPLVFFQSQTNPSVTLQFAHFKKKKRIYLFTIGLYAFHDPKMELSIVLPEEWNPYNKSSSNFFPVEFLASLVNFIVQRKITISETTLISANDPAFIHLDWPEAIAGFYPTNFLWGNEPNSNSPETTANSDIGPVELFSLLPVKRAKKDPPPVDINKNKSAGWGKITLKI